MIVFGSAVSDRETYERIALPGIEAVAEPDSVIDVREGFDSIQEPYNLILDEAAGREDLEAVVLVHQDLELLDESLLLRLRRLLAEPQVGLVGVLGWRGMKLHRWIDTGRLFGRSVAPGEDRVHSVGDHDVEMVDGVLLGVAPWVVRSLRFDSRLSRDFHGYDADYSLRVRAAGGRVVCSDIPYYHHMSRPWRDPREYVRAGLSLARMWDPGLRPDAWGPPRRPSAGQREAGP
jgi:GT2 family glycosyltransferase